MADGSQQSTTSKMARNETLKGPVDDEIPHHSEASDDEDGVERTLRDIAQARSLRHLRAEAIASARNAFADVGLVLTETHGIERRFTASRRGQRNLEPGFPARGRGPRAPLPNTPTDDRSFRESRCS